MMIESITPVVLVKDDAYYLPYCLESVAGRFSRMVIYDVGSTDGTVEIINWYVDKEKSRTDFSVRLLPFVPPAVQGTFRNAMIAEAQSDVYFILDADEIYNEDAMDRIEALANGWPDSGGRALPDEKKRYGVFSRIEISTDLKQRYEEERTHHRLYHRSAFWKGNHPGEVAYFKQRHSNELHYRDIKCLHMHNALRSPKEEDVPKRKIRKSQSTYHPGNKIDFNLLEEYPILREPIENFPVSPALSELQNV